MNIQQEESVDHIDLIDSVVAVLTVVEVLDERPVAEESSGRNLSGAQKMVLKTTVFGLQMRAELGHSEVRGLAIVAVAAAAVGNISVVHQEWVDDLDWDTSDQGEVAGYRKQVYMDVVHI